MTGKQSEAAEMAGGGGGKYSWMRDVSSRGLREAAARVIQDVYVFSLTLSLSLSLSLCLSLRLCLP